MEETLDSLYACLSLAEDEKSSIDGNLTSLYSPDITHSLVGKIIAPRIISSDQISSMFKKLWNPKGSFSCKPLKDNTVLLSSGDIVDLKNFAIDMVLETAKSDMVISNLEFDRSPFWVQIFDLSLGLMSKNFAKIAGNSIGSFIDVDCDASG
ncbi:hypothetical protein DH2020_008087 [Rehmannia glutinosa]|uniref:DUF4283 domain-containing protein n=1 Tax=Rehmannia glutinosa TaxID=99300 RepID=A0ABR0TZZ5_REHGL